VDVRLYLRIEVNWFGAPEALPKMEGRRMIVIIQPKKSAIKKKEKPKKDRGAKNKNKNKDKSSKAEAPEKTETSDNGEVS